MSRGIILYQSKQGATKKYVDWLVDALAIDNPLEYARLYLDGTMQMCIDAEDSLEVW